MIGRCEEFQTDQKLIWIWHGDGLCSSGAWGGKAPLVSLRNNSIRSFSVIGQHKLPPGLKLPHATALGQNACALWIRFRPLIALVIAVCDGTSQRGTAISCRCEDPDAGLGGLKYSHSSDPKLFTYPSSRYSQNIFHAEDALED